MSFENPNILIFLLFIFVLLPILILRYRKNREKAALFAAAAPSNERGVILRELRFRMLISELLFLLFLVFLIVALAGPRWGLRKVNDYRRGVDLVFAFDLSRSMNVEDCPAPSATNASHSQALGAAQGRVISRLERGRQIALDLALSLGDVRIGVAIGKGKGVLAVPLTYDTETVLSFLHALDSGIVTGSGTNLESLVDASIAAFQDSIPSRRVILLFSDGEGLSGFFQSAVDRAGRAAVTLSAVGLGSSQGGMVPVGTVTTGTVPLSGAYVTDPSGNPVISIRQDELLRAGAERSGGIYVDCGMEEAALVLEAYINSISSDSRLSGQRWEANPRFGLFIFAALLCLGVSRLMGYSFAKSTGNTKSRGYLRRARIIPHSSFLIPLFLLCLVMFSSCRETQGKLIIMEANFLNSRGNYTEAISAYLRALQYEGAAPYAEYGLASAFFALEESDSALDRYLEAENALERMGDEHNELRYRIHYNRGIIYFEKGEYNEAANAFREALKVDSSRIEAKRNLELSLLTDTWRSPLAVSSEGADNVSDNVQEDSTSQVLFEYLRAKEQEQWKSREWVEESDPSGLDY
ncbi:MAG: tetratricopeptide repeat protein [Treponema sp.]|nr:tetratricopeptide repeat protein [Treponema sp.]